jgi:pyridoxal phosphate enzyme (YggS family)
MSNIRENLENIRNEVALIGKSNLVEITVVTKTFPAEDILTALGCGIKHIGESKIQEALPKFETLKNSLNGITKHFIGHLQTNKVKKAVENFDLIQSLDSVKLAETINRYAGGLNKVQSCLIEVKVSLENSKTGIEADKVEELYNFCLGLKNVSIKGLMTIAANEPEPEKSRHYFVKVKKIFEYIKSSFRREEFKILSMGMSQDFKMAIQEGANLIRIGSAIFGERRYAVK